MVDTIFSGLSLQSWDRRLVLPEPERPMQTKSYSGRGGGGPLQQSALKHCQSKEKQTKQKKKKIKGRGYFSFWANIYSFNLLRRNFINLKALDRSKLWFQLILLTKSTINIIRPPQLNLEQLQKKNKYAC